MASPAQIPGDELPLAEGSSHQAAKKSHRHKKRKKHRHKGVDPAQSPGLTKKPHRQKRSIDGGAALADGERSPFSHSGEEQLGGLSSGGPAESNHLSPSSSDSDKPPSKDLSPSDEATARTGGAAVSKDAADLVSPDCLVSPTSASAAQKQSVERKDPRAADVTSGNGVKRSKKKHGKKKRSKGAEIQAPSSAEAMLSPLSPTSQKEQEAFSKPLSGEVMSPISSLSLNEKLKSSNKAASTSGPLSPMVEDEKLKLSGEAASPSRPLSPMVEDEKLRSSDEPASTSGPLSPMVEDEKLKSSDGPASTSGPVSPTVEDEKLKSSDEAASPSGPLSPSVDKKAGKETPIQAGELEISREPIPSSSTSLSPQKSDIVAVERRRHEVLCGVMGFYPGFLQSYRTPRCALTVLCLVSFTRSFSMNGVMMVVLPTLERRFQLKAYESGMILSSNDVASCLTMLPVAFLATERNKPRFIGYGIAMLGLGNLIVAMAHFLAPGYRLSAAGTDLCPMTGFSSSCTKTGSIRNYRFILMAGQLISGLGATPINTVTIAYLDENLPRRQSSLYIGIFNSMTIVGPAVGFIVGGYTLTYYVDISADVSSMGLTPKSPAWVGAWWLGSVVTAVMGLTLGVMTCSFPKYLPGYDAARAEKGDQSAVSLFSMIATSDFGRRLRDLPKAIQRLLTNVPFLFLCASFSFSQMFTTGLTAMMTKFFESQLGLSSARIAYMIGPIVLVGGGFGAIIGGALVSRWNLDYEGIMRLCMYNCCFSWFGVLIFTFSCPQGIYATPDGFVGEVVTSSFNWHCNADCNCTTSLLNPICGADGVVYLSPCLAGCERELQVKDLKMYSGCTCINGTMSDVPGVSSDQLLLEAVQATRSRCPTDCVLLFPFLAGVFLSLSACFLNAAPATAASIRCVKPAQRSLALGIRQVIGRLAGSIPAPVIFGGILDQTCLSWHRSCGKSGNCIVYENEGLSRGLFYALAVTLSFNMMCYYASLIAHRRYTHQHAEVKKNRPLLSN